MMKPVLILPFLLAACVSSETREMENISGVLPGTSFEIDGKTVVADQRRDWPVMQAQMDAAGNEVLVQSGTDDTVVVSGSPDSRDRAIAALARFCSRPDITPDGFDTQYVHQDPATGDWWFDGFRCEG